MPDCSQAWIEIGGSLPAGERARFAQAILDEALGHDWEGSFETLDEVNEAIDAAIAEGEGLRLTEHDAIGGMFENLEQLCRELGLTYSRADDGHYAYDAEFVFWEPGMEAPRSWAGSSDSNRPHLAGEEIEKLMQQPGALEAEVALMRRAQFETFPFVIKD